MKLDINKPKNLKFNTNGIKSKILSGFLRLEINKIEYGFPVTINEGSVSVTIPTLTNIIQEEIKNGENINARLDIIGSNYHMTPWNDRIIIKNIDISEIKLSESNKLGLKQNAKTIKKNINSESKKVITIEDTSLPITKELIYKFMEKNGTTKEVIKDVLYEQATMKLGDDPKIILKFFIDYYKKGNQ